MVCADVIIFDKGAERYKWECKNERSWPACNLPETASLVSSSLNDTRRTGERAGVCKSRLSSSRPAVPRPIGSACRSRLVSFFYSLSVVTPSSFLVSTPS